MRHWVRSWHVPSRRLGRRFQVRFRPIGASDLHVGYTVNISETGMFVATLRPLKPGTEVDLEISDKKHSLRLDAEVVHARKTPPIWQQVRPSGMGVRFLEMTDRTDGLRQLVGRSASVWG